MKSIIDEAFDIEPYESTELIDYDEMKYLPSTNVAHDEYDDKDSEIEDQYQEVYDKAMNAFEVQTEASADIEGKYMARNSEVANQLLNTALHAAKEKANLKKHSDELKIKKESRANLTMGDNGSVTNIQNNIVKMDRNELLRMMNETDID